MSELTDEELAAIRRHLAHLQQLRGEDDATRRIRLTDPEEEEDE